jgi:hypothetical protein
MAQQTINIGNSPNDGTGDTLRTAMDKSNDNFSELYSSVGIAPPINSTDNAIVRWDGVAADTLASSGVTIDDSNNLTVPGTVNGRNITNDGAKLDGIQVGADVTDAAAVIAAGGTINSDTDVSANGWVLDEDDLVSDDDTKVPTQQSVKAYADDRYNVAVAYTDTEVGNIPVFFDIMCGETNGIYDLTTSLTVGTGKSYFRAPFPMVIQQVRAHLAVAATGSDFIVDININGASIFTTTELTIDNGEKTSATADTVYNLTTFYIPDYAEITVDVSQIGSSIAGAGLQIQLIGLR